MFLTIKGVEQIGKQEFEAAALDSDHEVFIVYITVFNISSNIGDKVHLSKIA